jgi:hypothetical protein
LKHGRYAQQPIDGPVPTTAALDREQVLRQLRDAIVRDLARYANASRMSPREQSHVLNTLDRLRDIDDRLREMEANVPRDADADAPADWPQRLALLFANQPDQFGEFIMALLTADRARCGPLREQVRLTLNHLEPEGVPVWRGKKSGDSDTVLL